MTTATDLLEPIVWKGASALRPFIVPVGALEPSPGNPRRGDIEIVKESLKRFGQTRPVLSSTETIAEGMRMRVIAGHHVRLAAIDLGWTHVAVIPNEFASDEEAERYLLMDNRSHDRGEYELEELAAHLDALRDSGDGLAGTGYEESYLLSLERDIERWKADATPPPFFPPLEPGGMTTEFQCPHCNYEWSGSPRPNG
jgi:hypothetical protein